MKKSQSQKVLSKNSEEPLLKENQKLKKEVKILEKENQRLKERMMELDHFFKSKAKENFEMFSDYEKMQLSNQQNENQIKIKQLEKELKNKEDESLKYIEIINDLKNKSTDMENLYKNYCSKLDNLINIFNN